MKLRIVHPGRPSLIFLFYIFQLIVGNELPAQTTVIKRLELRSPGFASGGESVRHSDNWSTNKASEPHNTASSSAQFVDITASAGVAGSIADHGGHAIIFADINGDEKVDMYVTHTNFDPINLGQFLVLPDELFINNGNNTFTENAAAAGVIDPGQSHGAVFVDIDNDGDFDLFNGQRGPSGNRLYSNNGNGTFTEVTASAGILPADRGTIGVLAVDIDNDGDMDLLSSNWGVGSEMYVNDGTGHFTVENRGVTDAAPNPNGKMAATAADVDNDGDMDIFVGKSTDVASDASKLYINNGSGYFTDQTAARGVAYPGHSHGAVFVDLDWDGDLDMLLSVTGPDRSDPIIQLGVYRNQGNGTFVDETNLHNIPYDGFTLNAGDLDNDGDIDIFTYINSGTGQVWRNDGTGHFTPQTNAGFSHVANDARAAALADIDNDGDLDVAFTEIKHPTSLYRNDLINGTAAQNYLQINLTGANGRAGLFGSKFYLFEAGHLDDPAYLRGYQQLTSTLGTLSQNSPIVHFGVSPTKTYDLRVRLLDGNSLVRTNITPGQRLNLQTAPDTQPPVISSVTASALTASAVTITWITNEAADSQVEYGLTTSYGSASQLASSRVTGHSVVLAALPVTTTHHYRVKSRDASGNLAVSGDFTFTTSTLPPPFDVTLEAENMPIKTVGRAEPPGWKLGENGYISQNVSFPAAGLYQFTLRARGNFAGGDWAQAELRLDQVAQTVITVNNSAYADFVVEMTVGAGTHQVAIAFINDYYDPPEDGSLWVDWLRIQTIGPTDTQPPLVSNVAASNITNSATTITWTTDEASDSQVEYGLTTSYGSSSPLNSALVTSHTVALSSLQQNTTYHYRVKSRDAAGNLAASNDFTFTTNASVSGNVAFANVQDVFNNNCVRCHQGTTAPGALVLLPGQAHGNIVNVTSTEYPQWQRVQPGNRASSWLYEKITNATPPVGSKMGGLSADEIELIGKWIDQGATTTPVPPYVELQFRTPTVVNGEIYITYGASFTVWGGSPPYQFSVIDGALPPGLELDPTAGMIAGVPNAVGSYDFTIRVSDSRSPATTRDQAYRIEVFNTRDHWRLPPGFEIETVVGDLHLPVNIAFVPNPGPNPTDPYFYVTLLYGDIVMVQRNFQKQTYATGLLNFTPTGMFPGSGEIGVTGIVVDPVSRDVFASMVYEEGAAGSEDFSNKVVRFHSTDGGRTAATQTTIIDDIAAGISHMIQEVTIGPDGKLYVNIGDGWVPQSAPDLNDRRGKVLRLNLDGSTPEDNPFPNNQTYASGFRNPFGAAWRQADGTLYVSDNGTHIDDRIARVLPGNDYGWELSLPDLTKGAVFLWNPTVAPVAIDFLQNNAFPANYFGNLFVGLSWPPYQTGISERGKKIQRLVFNAGGQVVSDSLFLDYVGAGAATVIGVAFGADGLYFTDLYGENGFDQFGQTHGNVYRIRWNAGDVTPPVIANVQTLSVTGTSATIVWQTDEPATRQVEYGLTTNYGLSTPVASNLLTNHSVTLSQLTPATTYHFHVISLDAATNPAISADFTFTTTAIDVTPPVISNVQIDSVAVTSALVKWTTNEPASSFVDFGVTTGYGVTASNPQLATTHRVQLTGLADSTLYHFRVRSLDASGNAAASSDGTFTTRHNHNTQIGTRLEAENMPIKTVGRAEPPGWKLGENGYIAQNVSFPVTGLYQLTLRAYSNFAGGDWAHAELRLDQVAQTVITVNSSTYADFVAEMTVGAGTHEVAIAFINDYWDPPEDGSLWVDWLRIQSTGPPDTQPPVISNVAASNVSASAATLSWSTDEASDSQVEYGLTTSYGSSSPLNSALVTSHMVTLSSLQQNTTYHYRVKSRDAAGNLAVSSDFNFTTTASSASIEFREVTTAAGIAPVDPAGYGHGASFGDYNGDGPPDIFALIYGTANFLYRNNGNGTFTDIAAAAGVQGADAHDRGTATADYDNDGDEDIYIACGYTGNFLFRNNGDGTFTDVAGTAGINDFNQGQGVAWGDYDNDGLLDLFLCNSSGPNRLFHQNPNHTFAEASASAGIGEESSSAQPIFLDVENDGDLDIFVSRGANIPKLLYINDGNGHFSERAAAWGLADPEADGGGVTIADYDRDGDLDIYLANSNALPNRLYANRGGYFEEVAASAGVANGDGAGIFADFDDDGWPDLYIFNFGPNKLYHNNGDGTFSAVSSANGADDGASSHGFSTADYDGDGDLDIFFTNSGSDNTLLRNERSAQDASGQPINWLHVRLQGESSNRNGVGARLVAWTGGARQTQFILAGAGYVSGAYDLTAHFGLGRSQRVDSLIVYWPSGTRDRFYEVTANQSLRVREGSGGVTDTTPPVISNVLASNVTSAGATIAWHTNETADSQVEYGLTTSYGSSSPLNSAQVTSHTVALSSLPANTTFHYRVKSRDAAGNLATSGDFTFTTTADVAPVIANVTANNITASAATIAWSTDEASDSQVEYGLTTSYGSSSPLNSAQVTSHTVALSSLQPNTTYHYRVKSRDVGGNLATSGDFTLTTLSSTPALDVTLEAENMPIKTVGRAELPGWKLGENGYIAQNVSFPATGLCQFTLRARGNFAGGDWAQAELRLDQVAQTTITVNSSTYANFVVEMAVGAGTHEVAIAFINDYYDPPEDGSLWVDWLRIQSTGPTDTQPPVIANVAASNITTSASTISWSTDEASDSQVEYGLTTSYGSSSPLNSTQVTSHTVALSSLQQNTTFHYRVKSRDAAGNLATSGDFTFTTLQGEVIPPVIANVTANNITASAATLSWSTDEASDSQVEYGLTTSYGSSSPLNSAQVTSHTVALSSLPANTTFHYRVKSRDAAGNLATSGDFTFTTTADVAPVIANVTANNITASAATIAWSTDEASDSQVEYGLTTSYGSSSSLNSAQVTSHTVALSSLQPNTTFHYRVKSRDAAGNLATSGNFTLTTLSSTPALDVTLEAENMPIKTVGRVELPGWKLGENGYIAQNVSFPAAGLYQFTLRARGNFAGGDWAHAELRLEQVAQTVITVNRSTYGDFVVEMTVGAGTHQVAVAFINDYYDPPEDGSLWVDWLRIQSTGPTDTQPPVIANVAASNITTSAATLSWSTDEVSDSQVEYGLTTSYGSSSPLNSALVTSHAVALSSLQANTTYHYRVKSKDAAGNLATSGDFTFTTLPGDVTPPVISNVAASNITASAATIAWSTDEASDSQVEYGLTTSYGSSSPLNSALLISHTVALSSLQPNTTFHYRVKSRDAAGNLATSGDFAFTTTADVTPPVISNVAASNITASAATIAWSTNEASDSQVEYGVTASYGSSSPLNSALVISHTAALSSLQANTTFHYRVKSRDAAGNLATSGDFTLTTLTSAPALDVTLEAENMPIKTVGRAELPGWKLGENGYIAQNVSFPAAGLCQFTLRARGNFAGGDWAQAELRLDQVAQTVITVNSSAYADFVVEMTVGAGTHEVAIAFINDYYDPPDDGSLWVDWLRIQSTGPADTQPPVIANVAASNITASAATISWATDEASDSQVEYDLTTSYGSSSPLNSALVISHTVALSSLQANTTYHYRVKSKDAAGNLATSGDFTFTTLPGDVTPPVISNVAASNITASAATIAWSTDEASDSQVEYGLTTSYGSSSPLNSALLISHTVALSSLQQNTTFHYRVKSRDAAGNLATSGDFTFTTLTGEVIPPVISNVAASNITTSAATISWATDEASDSQVEYGLTTSYGSSSPLNSALVISHTVALSSLQPNTTFHYRVKSRDAAGNLATSGDFTFITTAPTADNVAFANVQDIFNNNCVRCHQGATAPGGLVLLPGQAHGNIVNVTSTEYPQWQRIQPGNRASSWLYEKITNATPPAGSKMGSLSAAEIELISKWIDQGATTTPVPPYVDLQFRTPTVVNGEIYIAYGASFTVWGGLPPYQFSVVDGALPPGLALDPTAGMLGGVPNTVGSYDFTIRVSDSQSPVAMIDQAYHLEVFNTRDHWQVPPGFEIETVVGDLHLPVNIAFVPNPGPNPTDPYFYVTLLYGDIVMVQRNFQKQTYATGLLNFTPTGEFPGSGEIGVIGIAVDPVSGDVFASMVYEETPGGENFRNKVVRFHSTDGGHTAATQTSLLDNIPAAISHMIQAVTIGPDGKLYVNVSDGWTPDAAPDINDRRGKVLRVNLDGSTPEDNPFPDSQVYASGFRNPFGAAWRQADGTLYISDNGPEFDDRVARVVPGGNYGWEANLPDLTKGAVFLWNPTVAPVAMDFLQNNAFPAHYFGNLFVGLSWPPYQTGVSERGKKIQRLVFNAGDQVISDSLFLDYVGAGAATVIGVAFGADGLYFTDLYGENGFDQFGQTHGNVYRIHWGATDVTPPAIANVEATFVTGTSATIVWQTDEPTTRQVEYGLTTNYGSSTPVASNLLTNHSVTLSQLTPATTYHFHVISLDASTNPAISADFTFTTTAIDVTPPVISNVQIDSVAATSALVKWMTDEPASSFVDFGATADYGATTSNPRLVTAHRVQLTRLADSTLYHFRVRSLDASGNAAASSDGTFTTRHHPQIDTTLEAENMPIKTVGQAELPGWKLGDEGYIAENVSFPATGLYQLTLRAYSNFAGGDWAQAELRLDQVAQTVITVNRSTYADFVVEMTIGAGTHEVAIAFINNYYDPPDDRSLWVDWLRIQTSSAGGNVIKSKTAASAVTSPPATVALQNYPNPFNDATRIRFALPQAAEIEIKIFDMAGHELLELANGERAAGSHEVIWNGRGRNGNESDSGVYLVRLRYRSDKNGAWSQLRQRVLLVK